MITPLQVEKRLLDLSRELDEAQRDLEAAEMRYFTAKADYELAMARSLLELEDSGKITIPIKEAKTLVKCAREHVALHTAEAVVRAARANATRIRIQVDIARSVGTSVRASVDMH